MNSDSNPGTFNVSPPSMLGNLILARMIAGKNPPTRSDLVKALKPLFPADLRGSDGDWKELVNRTLEELAASEKITDAVRNIRITQAGERDLKAFLNVDALPERKQWGSIKKSYLTPLAIGARPTKTEANNATSSDGFKAAVLVKLFGLRLNPYPSLPQAIRALVAQKGVKTQTNSLDSLRDAFLENWISSLSADNVYSERDSRASTPKTPIHRPTTDLTVFATKVKDIARSLRNESTGEKVLISRIWQQFQSQNTVEDAITRNQFDQNLLLSNREQLLTLSRAELLGNVSDQERQESEVTPASGDGFHFVRTDRN
ncbi:MAG: hypothetical protein R3C59_02090 [Planctomycetaceae bacterium]